MDTAWLEVFREVARSGSFTAAGTTLGYTQSAVSRQMATLEGELGARLFERLPRGVRLTEEGHCLLRHCDAVLDRLGAARRDLRALRARDGGGQLRIGTFATANAALVPAAMAAFAVAHPTVRHCVVGGRTPRQLARLRSGEIDLAVVSAFPHRPLDGEGLDGLSLEHLLDDPIMVALPRTHRHAARRVLRLHEVAHETWIAASTVTETTLIDTFVGAGARPRVDLVAGDWTTKQGLVAAGLGITLVPSLAARAVRGDIALVGLHPDDAAARAVYAATPGHTDPAAVAAFRGFLRRSVAELWPG